MSGGSEAVRQQSKWRATILFIEEIIKEPLFLRWQSYLEVLLVPLPPDIRLDVNRMYRCCVRPLTFLRLPLSLHVVLVRDVVPTTVLIARADELEAAIILDRKNQWHSLQSDRRCHAWSCCSGRAISHTSEICDKYGILPIADEVMTDWAEPAPHLV